jgi:hypothetical protein
MLPAYAGTGTPLARGATRATAPHPFLRSTATLACDRPSRSIFAARFEITAPG